VATVVDVARNSRAACYGSDVRLFSRIGTWLRARGPVRDVVPPAAAPPSGATAPQPPAPLDPLLLARLPRTEPATFVQRLLAAVDASRASVQVAELDPAVRLIAMSQRELSDDAEIDNALRSVESSAVRWSSLTWSALRDARPPFTPGPAEWGGELAHLLDGDAGLIFFVDVEAIATAVAQAVERRGFAAAIEADGVIVRASDGRFQAEIGTGALIAEALWTGTGPLAAVMRRADQIPHELRSFSALVRAFDRAFPGVRFEVVGDHVIARRADHPPLRLDYRHWAASARSSGLSGDAFLRGARLDDLVDDGQGEIVALLRSSAWAKAWPDMLSRPHDGGGVLCVGREGNGRVAPIKRGKDEDNEARLVFLEREARRQLPFLRVSGHAFFLERPIIGRGVERALGLVSDRAASLLLEPALLRGLCEQLGGVPRAVKVACATENLIVVAAEDTSEATIDEALRRGAQLEADLDDGGGADALTARLTVALPARGAGHFDLTIVADEFFALCDQANAASEYGRIQRDYVRGLALETLGLTGKAVASFERAARRRNDDGDVNLALGRALTASGEHARAVSVLGRAVAALPDRADAQNALGLALYKSGAATDARAAFLRAVHLSPDEVGFLVNLGRTCCDQEMFTEARAVLEHALKMEPSSAEAHASMAVLCHRTGNRQRALHHARAALAEQPDDDTLKELLRIVNDDAC